MRTLRQDLANRYGTLVPITSPVFTWLVKHAQFLLNNFAIRSDGLTPFERRWSKRYASALRKFGEIVLCRLRGKQPKADPSWAPGLWLGRDTSADTHVVGTTSGVFKTRSICRLPVSEQVDKQLLKAILFTWTTKASESFLRRGHAIHDSPLKQLPHVSLQLYNIIHVWQPIWGHESI